MEVFSQTYWEMISSPDWLLNSPQSCLSVGKPRGACPSKAKEAETDTDVLGERNAGDGSLLELHYVGFYRTGSDLLWVSFPSQASISYSSFLEHLLSARHRWVP